MPDLAPIAALITAIAALLGSVALVIRARRSAARSLRPPPPAPDPTPTPLPASRSLRRILVVDDDPSEARAIRAVLLAEIPDVAVEIVGDGEAALDVLAERAIDLLVLDVMMSGISGPEIAGHLRASWPARRTPVLLFSGLDPLALEAVRASCGADAAVSKDEPRRLAEIARGLLARR